MLKIKQSITLLFFTVFLINGCGNSTTKVLDKNQTEALNTENNSTEDTILTENNSTEDTISTENNSTENTILTENNSTEDTISTENNSTEDTISTENNSTEDTISTENNSTEDTISTENNSTEDTISTENNSTLTGKVIDGEISEATLFLDLNRDGQLNENEPSTKTKRDGSYTLTLTPIDRANENYKNRTAPLIAFGGEDIRTKEAFNDYLIALIDESNLTYITPFSTLIAQTLFDELETEKSKQFKTTPEEQLLSIEAKIASIKKSLAELFGIKESILNKNPIDLAKEGDSSLLNHSLQLHKSAKEMKKAMKSDVRNLKRSILQTYKALGKSLKKLNRNALKSGDNPLVIAVEKTMEESSIFDTNLVEEVKKETKSIIQEINNFWKGQEGTLTDSALSDAIKETETHLVKDTTPPIITLIGSATVTLTEGETYIDAGATALDNKDGVITSNISIDNTVDTTQSGEYHVKYNVKDSSNNSATEVIRTVLVLVAPDTIPPIITLNGEQSITITKGESYSDAGATALDNKDGEISHKIVVTNLVDSSVEGSYFVKYNVQDEANNSAVEVSRSVIVVAPPIITPPKDTTPPVITLIGDVNLSIILGTPYIDAGATANDDRDGTLSVVITGELNSSKVGIYTKTYTATDSAGNHASVIRTVNVLVDTHAYIPKILDDATAIRFLNKATFGATKESINDLKAKGVELWIDEQLNLALNENQYLIKTIELAKKMSPENNQNSIEEYLADNDIVFNQNVASFHSPRYRMSAWFDTVLTESDQLRQRVTYALSQIIVESDFEPIFTRRADALASYYDILQRNAFGNYKDLLNEISLNSGMGVFLTFNGSKKSYSNEANVTVYPDENYARELMQLFSLGLNKLNIDGTAIVDNNGNPIPTYTQEDVNELARIFTGWDLKRNSRYGRVGFKQGDYTQPLEFTAEYHDSGSKTLLGESIPAGLGGEDDIKKAIDIIMTKDSVAPYISRNLIMRLTKSNPTSNYIERVATVFKNSNGDLKAVTKAILLDEELWEDINQKRVIKFKEPLLAYTTFLRAFNTKPFPSWYYCGYGGPVDDTASNCQVVEDSFLFNDPRNFLNQGSALAPTVFNFYDNDFVPNSTAFKSENAVAPEIQIQSDTIFINLSNEIRSNLLNWEKNYILNNHFLKDGEKIRYQTIEAYIADAPSQGRIPLYYVGANKMLLDVSDELNVMEMVIDGDSDGDFKNLQHYQEQDYTDDEKAVDVLVEHLNQKLTGGLLTAQETAIIADNLKDKIFNKYNSGVASNIDESKENKKRQLLTGVIFKAIRAVVTSSAYMTE